MYRMRILFSICRETNNAKCVACDDVEHDNKRRDYWSCQYRGVVLCTDEMASLVD